MSVLRSSLSMISKRWRKYFLKTSPATSATEWATWTRLSMLPDFSVSAKKSQLEEEEVEEWIGWMDLRRVEREEKETQRERG